MREHRQFLIALRAEARTPLRAPDDATDFAAENERAEREAKAATERWRAAERSARAESDPEETSE